MQVSKRAFPFLLVGILLFQMPSDINFRQTANPGPNDEAIITYSWHNPEDRDQPVLFNLLCKDLRAHFQAATGAEKYEQCLFDTKHQTVTRLSRTGNRANISTVSVFKDLPAGEITHDELKILGHTCQKIRFTILTDTLDAWVWKQGELRGSPVYNLITNDGVILRVDKNKVPLYIALTIQYKKLSAREFAWPQKPALFTSFAQYEALKRKSNELTISVFDHEKIAYRPNDKHAGLNKTTSTYHYAEGTVIVKLVKLPLIKSDYSLFAELGDYSNGDPQSRQGSVFIIPADRKVSMLDALEKGIRMLPAFKSLNGKTYHGFLKTAAYDPIIELMRFNTPYGIKAFSHQLLPAGAQWADSVCWKQDISELKSVLQHEVYVGIYIHSNNPAGQTVNLNLRFYPVSQLAEKGKTFVEPLFNTVNILQTRGQQPGTLFQGDSLHVKFIIPNGLQDLTFRYITSGEGLWPDGEAFKLRLNQVFWDDDELLKITPWRTDCGSYRIFNPASPVTSNGMPESDYSRAGWCPGSLTLPVSINLEDPEPGQHEIRVLIPVDNATVSQSGFWNVSGVLIGHYGPKTGFLHRKTKKSLLQE